MQLLIPVFIALMISCSAQKSDHETDSAPATTLYIVQDGIKNQVKENGQIVILKSKPFQLHFISSNTEKIYLHASTEASSYLKAINKEWDKLECFYPPQTFAEYRKNTDRDISVCEDPTRGFHCLFGFAHTPEDEEFIRFDEVQKTSDTEWIGIRTVNQITALDSANGSTTILTPALSGRTIYLTYSPGIEKQGWGVKLQFE